MTLLDMKTIRFNGTVVGLLGNWRTNANLFHKMYPDLDNLNKRHGTSFKLIDPRFADKVLKIKWPQMLGSFPFATDAVIGHEKAGVHLGSEIIFSQPGKPNYVLPTGRHRGQKDAAVVVLGLSSEDIKNDGDDVVFDVPASRIFLVPNFPAADGSYEKHAETTVPCGDPVEKPHREHARLNRATQAYVGSIVRDSDAWTLRTSFLVWDELSMVVTGPEDDFKRLGVLEPESISARLSSRPPPSRMPEEAKGPIRRFLDSIRPKG